MTENKKELISQFATAKKLIDEAHDFALEQIKLPLKWKRISDGHEITLQQETAFSCLYGGYMGLSNSVWYSDNSGQYVISYDNLMKCYEVVEEGVLIKGSDFIEDDKNGS